MASSFILGNEYTRDDVGDVIGFPVGQRRGGVWTTGYIRWNGEIIIFSNVGVAGRTGHDYPNRWVGKELVWYGKTATTVEQPLVKEMLAGAMPVHVFWRGSDRAPFTYAGLAHAVEYRPTTPVEITWGFEQLAAATAATETTEFQAGTPPFRRGPPPTVGVQAVTKIDGPASVYLMVLQGPVDEVFPQLEAGELIVKVGMSNSPIRRLRELNSGFPPGCALKWALKKERNFPTGDAAYLHEYAILERLRLAKRWIGGEFGRIPSSLVPSLLD